MTTRDISETVLAASTTEVGGGGYRGNRSYAGGSKV